METITTTLTTEAIFNDNRTKRYLLHKSWNENLPKLTIVMLAPSEASGVALDTTTQLCLNNSSRLGYGSITIVNLFATINDFDLKQQTGFGDPDNLKAIVEACQNCDQIVYAPGTGKAKNKTFINRQEEVLKALLPLEEKLSCLCNEICNTRLHHPLSPAVRTWELSPLKVSELIDLNPQEPKPPEKKAKGRPKVTKKEPKTD